MSRNIIVHDVNMTSVAEPNEPASFTVRVEPGETVRAIRQKVANMARSGRINDVLYFIYAGRRLNDDDVLPADITYVAVKFASPAAAAAAAAAGPGAGAAGGRRRRSTRRRSSKAKRGGSRRGSRRHRRSTRRSKRSGHRKH